MAAPTLRPLSIGEVLDVAFGLYRSMFARLLVVAVACRLIPTLLQVYLRASGTRMLEADPTRTLGYYLAALILGLILNSVGVAATTYLVSEAYLGRETTAGVALGRAVSLIGKLIVLSFLMGLIIGIGLLLFIVPGLIFGVGLALSSVVLVLESRTASDAMGRSLALTKGYRWKVLGTVLVPFLLLIVPGMAVEGLGSLLGSEAESRRLWTDTAAALLEIVIYPYIYTVITVLYYDLRVRKEGFDLEVLASAMQPA